MDPPVPVTEYQTPGEVTATVHAGRPLSIEAPTVAPLVDDGTPTARAVAQVSFGTQAIVRSPVPLRPEAPPTRIFSGLPCTAAGSVILEVAPVQPLPLSLQATRLPLVAGQARLE